MPIFEVAAQLERTGSSSEVFARQRHLNQFLLDVAKSIFQDIVSMDTVIIKVMVGSPSNPEDLRQRNDIFLELRRQTGGRRQSVAISR